MKTTTAILSAIFIVSTASCQSKQQKQVPASTAKTETEKVKLPPPFATKSVKNYSNVNKWPEGKSPVAPVGFKVERFADGLDNPRNIYVAPNGDIFVAQANTEVKGIKKIGAALIGVSKSQKLSKSSNTVLLLRDTNRDGKPDIRTVFLSGLNQPYGILIFNDWFYVANTDGLWRYPYKTGETVMKAAGKMITDLPAGGYNNHWTRNLTTKSGKILISVGSGTNIAEQGLANEVNRAAILEINPDGTGKHVYAGGLRNPVGIAVNQQSGMVWAAVNERDELGDNLVPDYVTSVKPGGFYGWPLGYFGPNADPSYKGPKDDALLKKTIVPDVELGAHTASLGLTFYNSNKFPARYRQGAFIGQHGSWNRSVLSGYKVVFVPFKNGKPAGKYEDFLTGFVPNPTEKKVYGRPVGVAVAPDGALLVADDAGNTIWRVSAQ